MSINIILLADTVVESQQFVTYGDIIDKCNLSSGRCDAHALDG